MSEHHEQVALVSWFKARYPNYRDCIMAIPNGSAFVGGTKKISNLARYEYLVAEGLKKGTSDLFIAVPVNGKCGLWVEMKDVNKTLCTVSKEQREHLDLMRKMGYEAVWCSGFEVAKAAVETYLKEG